MQTRKRFVAGLAGGAGALVLAPRAARAETLSFKYGHNLPVEHPLHVRMVEMWAAVRKESSGRLDVTIFPNNELGGDTAMLTQLRSGALQFMTLAGAILASVVPVAGIESVGFAFKSPDAPFPAMDGRLGAYIRKEIEARDLVVFEKVWDLGLRQVTTGTKPIASVADLDGLKIRTPPGKAWIDLFRALGASPTPINFSETYTALQTHVVDAQETPLLTIEVARIYEVQKYLTMTNHMWSGYWLLANPDAWKQIPPDVQAIVARNAAKYAPLQRRDVALLNASLSDKLHRQGLTINTVDTGPFRAKLAPQYEKWKDEYGATAWGLLESYVGKLG